MLGFIRTGLQDFSISRSTERAHGWGIEVPGDASAARALSDALALLVHASRVVAAELTPFLPDAATRVAAQLGNGSSQLGKPEPLFPRIEAPAAPAAR